MPGLRLLLRLAPVLVGVVAAAVWLRRRPLARAQLPAPPVAPRIEAPPSETVDIVTVVDDLLLIGR